MQLNHKSLAVIIIGAAGLVAGAYMVGKKQGEGTGDVQRKAGQFNQAAQTPASQPVRVMPVAMENGAAEGKLGLDTKAKFAHFRVGNKNVKSLFADGKVVWIGTSGGVVRYDTTNDTYKLIDNRSGLLSNGIFYVGRIQGKLMVGTYGGGLSVLDEAAGTWKNYNIPNGLGDAFVYDVIEMANGDVWIATWSGANLVRQGDFDNPKAWQTFTVENTKGGLPNPWVYGVREGLNGDIWFATESGLALYRNGQWQNWQHKDGLGADHELVKDANPFKNDPGKASSHHSRQKQEQGLEGVNDAYNPNYVISMAVQGDGVVWAGTWGAGLSRFDGKQWKTYTTKDGLPANHIFMLYLDNKQQLWIGTSQGLARFDPKTERFEVKGVADGLYAENVFSMANGADGSLWIGSFGGVSHIEQGW